MLWSRDGTRALVLEAFDLLTRLVLSVAYYLCIRDGGVVRV